MQRATRAALILLPLLFFTVFLAAQNTERDWKQFRQAYPYHLQVVAVSRPDAEGYRTLVVSEPPPQVTVESFRQIAPDLLKNTAVAQHDIGVNGWVRDIVAQLPPVTDRQLTELIDEIHHGLFATSYKAYAVPIPDRVAPRQAINLDLHVTSAELNKWLVGDVADVPAETWSGGRIALLLLLILLSAWRVVVNLKKRRFGRLILLSLIAICVAWALVPSSGVMSDSARLRPITGGEPVTLRAILDNQRSGVFYTDTAGFIVWSIPRSASLDSYRIEAREFSVDSDLLVGAVASDKQLAIIGRERVTPVELLPPLRTETILQLAAANQSELAQSYERKYIFAGRFNKTDDWAPIYLSDELIDTEYGSLLNITDQMLKSWSEHGDIKYANFNYAAPPDYPFTAPVTVRYKVHELTFNWNTKGVGYTEQSGPYQVFALNRLGALPVDYLARSNQDLQNAEDIAYKYYRGLNDPNLVRVVEYAGLYQIFRHFQIGATTPVLHRAHVVTAVRPLAAAAIQNISSITDQELERAKAHSSGNEDLRQVEELTKLRDALIEFESEGDDSQKQMLEAALADPVVLRSLISKAKSDESAQAIVVLASGIADMRNYFEGNPRENAVVAAIYEKQSSRDDVGWIHTPTIVVSRAQGTMTGAVGGHNLSATITELRSDSDVVAGTVRVADENGTKIVYYNPSDAEKAPQIVRTAGRYEDKSSAELQDMLNGEMKQVQAIERPVNEMLGFTAEAKPSELRGMQPAHVGAGGESAGWRPAGTAIPPEDSDVLVAFKPRKGAVNRLGSVIITKNPDNTYLVVNGSEQIITASDAPSAIDAALMCIRNDDSATVNLHFRGFDPRQAKGFVRTAELQTDPETATRISATIEESMSPADLGKLASEDYDFKRARVTSVSPVKITEDGPAVDIGMEVPAKAAQRPSLFMRIKIFLAEKIEFTQQMLDSLVTRFQAIAFDPNPLLSAKRIVKDLRSVHPGIKGVELQLGNDSKDVLLVLRRNSIRSQTETGQPA